MKTISIDVEHVNKSKRFSPFYGERLLTVAAFDGKKTYFWNIGHEGAPKTELTSLLDMLKDPNIEWVQHNIKHDFLWLEVYLPEIALDAPDIISGKYFCTMIASDLLHLVDRERGEKNNLETLAIKYCNFEPWKADVKINDLENEPFEKVKEYNINDAIRSWHVGQYIKPLLETGTKHHHMPQIKRFKWEMKNLRVLLEMEKRGIKVDKVATYRAGLKVYKDLEKAEGYLKKLAGYDINIRSNPQLTNFLYQELKMPALNVSKITGADSADDAALNAIIWELKENPNRYNGSSNKWLKVIEALKQARANGKLWDTYLSQIPEFIQWDGKVHCKFHLGKGSSGDPKHEYGTRTARLSSSDPNMQNIPATNTMRNIYIAEDGNILIDPDYKQLELVVLAYYSQDPVLVDAIRRNRDIHSTTLARVEKISYEDLTTILKNKTHKDYEYFYRQRKVIKPVNFGILFGIGVHHLQEVLREIGVDMSLHEIKLFIEQWFNEFPAVDNYIKTTQKEARDFGFVKTATGLIIPTPWAMLDPETGKHEGMNSEVQRNYRQAVNGKIQSLAADICKTAMQLIDQKHPKLIRLQIHDNLLSECRKEEKDYYVPEIKKLMTTETIKYLKSYFNVDFNIPLNVDIKTGVRWRN